MMIYEVTQGVVLVACCVLPESRHWRVRLKALIQNLLTTIQGVFVRSTLDKSNFNQLNCEGILAPPLAVSPEAPVNLPPGPSAPENVKRE